MISGGKLQPLFKCLAVIVLHFSEAVCWLKEPANDSYH